MQPPGNSYTPAMFEFETPSSSKAHVFSVSELNNSVKQMLENNFPSVWLEGEISNLARPRSGHVYLTLKDDGAQIRAAMFRSSAQQIRFPLKDGLQVLVRGRLSLYGARGDYQLIADHMEEAGLGALQRAFEQLKQKLKSEGLFDEQRKKPIPVNPRIIGVITSPSGAAIHDILSVLKRRFPLTEIILYPALVQGADGAKDVLRALEAANRRNECEVLIIGRGGGSLEDLWSFNDETLARAIAESKIPTVSAVGHQVDFTIADFVADARAPTPSAAAEMLSANGAEIIAQLARLERQLVETIERQINQQCLALQNLQSRLQHPGRRLQEHAQRLDELDMRLRQSTLRHFKLLQMTLDSAQSRLRAKSPVNVIVSEQKALASLERALSKAMAHHINQAATRFQHLAHQLNTVSPLQTLSRGYSITQELDTGATIQSTHSVAVGQSIRSRLHQGAIISQITAVEPTE